MAERSAGHLLQKEYGEELFVLSGNKRLDREQAL